MILDLMKKHEQNAAKGDLFTSGGEEFEQIKEEEVCPNGRVFDLVLPVAVLIVSAVGAMIYTGFLGGATDIITAFAGCDAETSLIFATMITVFFMLLLYLPRKVVTFKGFMDSFVEGFKLMIPAVAILIFAWSLKGVGDALGIAAFVEGLVGSNTSASIFIPAIMFMIAIFLAFSTGTSWGNIRNPCSNRHCHVPGSRPFGNDDHCCFGCSCRSCLRRPCIADFRYNGYVFGGSPEQSYQSCVDSDAVCDGGCCCLHRWISHRRFCENMVGDFGTEYRHFIHCADFYEKIFRWEKREGCSE